MALPRGRSAISKSPTAAGWYENRLSCRTTPDGDGGETFAAVAPPDLSRATDLAQLGRRCVVGLGRSDGGATLWASEDGSDFSILVEGFTEPVARLAADAGGTLAVATQSRGVFRAHVE